MAAPDPDRYLDHVLAHVDEQTSGVPRPGPVASWTMWWQDVARTLVGPVESLAVGQGFALTSGQLREAGWAPHDLRREIRRGEWSAPTRGTAAPIGTSKLANCDEHETARRKHALQSAAAALLHRDHVIGARSAAILLGLPTLAIPGQPELTTCTEETLGRRARVHVRSAGLREESIDSWFGAPITSPARTVVDRCRLDRREGLVLADAALAESLTTLRELHRELDLAQGWPGVRQAREIVSLASPLSESPLESLLRLALHDSGFPPPRLQVEIADPSRRRKYRVDMLLESQRLILEADGRVKYTGDALWREKERETRLRALGYRIERVLWSDVTTHWADTSARLQTALRG